MADETQASAAAPKKQLSRFKYVPGKDTGVNPDKSKTLYGIVFPAGKDVEVPDDLVNKLRVQPEMQEVSSDVHTSEAVKQHQDAVKAEQKKSADEDKKTVTGDELKELKAKASQEDTRVAKLQSDAKLGR